MPPKRKRSPELASSSEESSSEEVAKKRNRRAARGIDKSFMKELQLKAEMKDKRIHVKCNQSGKVYKPKIAALSNENGGLTIADLAKGSQLMMDIDKSSYPVTVLKVTSVTGEEFNVLNDNDEQSYETKSPPTEHSLSDVMKQAKAAFTEDDISDTERVNPSPLLSCNSTPRRKQYSSTEIMNVLLDIQSTLKALVHNKGASTTTAIKTEEDPKHIVNGVNILQLPAKDAYAYGRCLLDTLFTKEELAKSVIYKTKKSDKPPLSPTRVQTMFDCIDTRYKEYEHKTMMTTLGQKCRDSGRELAHKN